MTRKKDLLEGVEISVNGKKLGAAARKKLLGQNNDHESDQDEDEINTISITNAVLKDGICNYSFEIIDGVGQGATHNVKGPGIVKDSLRDVFAKYNVHMAVIDDAFKTAGREISDIDQMHSDELTALYHVEELKIKGSVENERIILKGNKYVSSAGGRMKLETPEIPIDNLSSYKWYNELKELTKDARKEVKSYNDGNYTPIEVEEEESEKPNHRQLTIMDGHNEEKVSDDKFSEAEV